MKFIEQNFDCHLFDLIMSPIVDSACVKTVISFQTLDITFMSTASEASQIQSLSSWRF